MYNKLSKIAPIAISHQELLKQLALTLPDWQLSSTGKSIIKNYTLPNYENTWAFLQQVAMRSHLWGHHPSITTVYNKVKIELTTHDVNGVSDIDIKLGTKIDKYASYFINQK
ncbi:related to Putative pterin-4-alpha-carbinolamine dehydratase [Saccharomycodes ludwigii]|uniref:4a-hydroxytetrahydrobiopterin dehydratase n=1 Tax=Saccharomycodes ludwigii TaxID=36035 RepID=A0A376BB72_9ASCO|nr:hypothetical protein SCDLUD_004196 [Saccharomycodes ludwigii]KAH3899893.1 hypothetical protein SCDLUD_004196 [Saccharomycodes ludwigii]SSD61877.1 related to Putative pterin-4-alpha-carbinolamine dehydratase [Saccharomycodes ludwigii]